MHTMLTRSINGGRQQLKASGVVLCVCHAVGMHNNALAGLALTVRTKTSSLFIINAATVQ